MKGYDDIILNALSKMKKEISKPKLFKVRYKIICNSKKTIIYYHGWGSSSEVFSYLKTNLKKEYSVILFDYPVEALSSDTKKTVHYFEEVLDKTKEAISKLNSKEINLFGTSLGSFLSVYIAKRIKVDKMILSVGGSRLSDVVWTSIATRKIKDELVKKGIGLKELRKEWKAIEPINNISATKVLAFTSARDMLVLYEYQKELSDAFDAIEIKEPLFGHDVTCLRNLMDLKNVREFLKQ